MKKRNKFSLSHYRLFSCKMGYIIPIGLVETLPGDTFQHATSLFLRVSPLVTPVMHPVHVIIHHWFIPMRLLWDDWEDFITGGPDGMNASTIPQMLLGDTKTPTVVSSLGDYLGIPTGIPGLHASALPFRAYQLLYNECYRDQDLEEPVGFSTESTDDDKVTDRGLQRSDWARDYFTTARPWPQKGPEVTVPVTSSSLSGTLRVSPGPVNLGGLSSPLFSNNSQGVSASPLMSDVMNQPASGGSPVTMFVNATGHGDPSQKRGLGWHDPNLVVNLAQAGKIELGSVDVNALREAFALQRFEEHRALYGSRYVEYLRYLGVRSSDARLQRPEYLGGSKQTIQFSEVLQTAEGENPVGTLRGHGIAASRTPRYRRFFEEHGYVLSVMMVRPVSVYMQGLNRLWDRRVKEDFFQRELQHIGQQEVLTREVYAGSSSAETSRDTVFGYQNRYDEYRSMQSYVSGEFRTILNSWHMARDFANTPALNADFINSVPTTRIFASQDTDTLYCMANHSIQARRIISKFGNPI